MTQRAVVLVALVLVAAACTSQQVPARSRLPAIEAYEPTAAYEVDPAEVFPNDGTCAVASGEGARVLEILEGYPAEEVLRLADVIVEAEGHRISSAEALLTVMSGRAPGEVVELIVLRSGDRVPVEVLLHAVDAEPNRGLMGIIPTSIYSVHDPGSVPLVETPAGPQRHIFIGDDLYLLDPLSIEWQLHAEDVGTDLATVALGSEVYALANPTNSTAVLALRSGEIFDVAAGDWRFVRPLGTVGGLVLMSSVKSADETLATVSDIGVVAVDLGAGTVAWEWRPGTSPNTLPLLADTAFRSPSGALAALTLSEITSETDITPQRFHVLLDADGNELTGWGSASRTFVPDNAVLSGFFNESLVMYGGLVEAGLQLAVFSLEDASASEIGVVNLDGSGQPPRFLTVGDGRHLLAITTDEVSLVDSERNVMGRPIIRSCDIRLGDFGFGV